MTVRLLHSNKIRNHLETEAFEEKHGKLGPFGNGIVLLTDARKGEATKRIINFVPMGHKIG